MQIDQAIISSRGPTRFRRPRIEVGEKIARPAGSQRMILTASAGGVREFIIIGGGEAWDEEFSSLQEDKRLKERSLRLKSVPLSDMEGADLANSIKGRFWLMDGDLVFDQELLTRARGLSSAGTRRCTWSIAVRTGAGMSGTACAAGPTGMP